jgi:hypothetical protein
VPQCKTYLKDNYKPYGRLNDRSEFATEEAYQTHYQAFMSANYANEITDFGENAKSAEVVANEKFSSATKLLVLGAVIFFVVAIALDLALYFRKSERGYFKKRQKAGKIKCSSSHSVYYLNSMIVQIIISIATVSVVVFVLLKSLTIYVPASYIIWKYFVIVAVMILTAIIANGLSVILVKNRQKFQQQKSDKLQSNSEVKKQEPSNVKEDSEDGKQEPDKNGSAEQKPSNGNADTEEGKQEPDKNGAAEQEQLKAKKIQKK